MTLIGNILADGVAYAMILFMISVGMSMTMGLMRLVNMAHGSFAMIGGFLTVAIVARFGWRFEVGAALAILAVALVAIPIERWLIRLFYRRPPLDQMLMTMGIMFLSIATIEAMFGSTTTAITMPGYMTGSADLGFRLFPRHRLAVIVLGLVVVLALWLVVERSTFGIKVRAAVDDPAIAQAVGIDTSRIHVIAFATGAALAALGGIAGAELLPMESSYAAKYLVVILAVVAVGGHGTLFGSFLAALLLGLVETAAKYLIPDLSSIAFFLTMFLVLLARPQGLMGRGAH